MHTAEQEPALIGAVQGYGTASNCWSWSSEGRRGYDPGFGLDVGTESYGDPPLWVGGGLPYALPNRA